MHRCLSAAGTSADGNNPSGREIITVSCLQKGMEAVQGHRRPLTFICSTPAALALFPFVFPSPECIPSSPSPGWQRSLSGVLPYSKQVQMCDLRETWLGPNKREPQTASPECSQLCFPAASLPAPRHSREMRIVHLHYKPQLSESILLPSHSSGRDLWLLSALCWPWPWLRAIQGERTYEN